MLLTRLRLIDVGSDLYIGSVRIRLSPPDSFDYFRLQLSNVGTLNCGVPLKGFGRSKIRWNGED